MEPETKTPEETEGWASGSGTDAEPPPGGVAEATEGEAKDEPAQLPLEKWSEHQLAEAGVELTIHRRKLKKYEDAEKKHKRHYKENHDRMVDVIEGLELRIYEQRHALGIDSEERSDEEEEE